MYFECGSFDLFSLARWQHIKFDLALVMDTSHSGSSIFETKGRLTSED